MQTTSGAWGRMSWRLGAVIGAASLALIATGAAAKPADSTIDTGKSLTVAVTGRIVPRCEIQGGGDIDFGELTGGESATALFGLDCNTPFDLEMESANGGLANVRQPQGEGPFSGLLPYDVRLTVPTLRPTPVVVQGGFSSTQRTALLSSGDGISAGGGKIEIKTRRPTGAGLLAGQYSETLTLTVTPRV